LSFVAPGNYEAQHGTDLYVCLSPNATSGDFEVLLPGKEKEVVYRGDWPLKAPVEIKGAGTFDQGRRSVDNQALPFSLKYADPSLDQFYKLAVTKGDRLWRVYAGGSVGDKASGKTAQAFWRIEDVAPTDTGSLSLVSLEVLRLEFRGVVLGHNVASGR
jgi:hypothetical protein